MQHFAALSAAGCGNFRGVFAGMYRYTHPFNFLLQLFTAERIELFRHQDWRKFNNMGFNTQVFQGPGGFQPQQTTADHHTFAAVAGAGFNGIEIFNRPVNKTVAGITAFDRRDPRIRAGRNHQLVVMHSAAGIGMQHLFLTVNGNHPFID